MRRSQCLTPHHLETVARSLTRESNRSWSSVYAQLQVRTGHVSFLWFGTSPFHICAVYIHYIQLGKTWSPILVVLCVLAQNFKCWLLNGSCYSARNNQIHFLYDMICPAILLINTMVFGSWLFQGHSPPIWHMKFSLPIRSIGCM